MANSADSVDQPLSGSTPAGPPRRRRSARREQGPPEPVAANTTESTAPHTFAGAVAGNQFAAGAAAGNDVFANDTVHPQQPTHTERPVDTERPTDSERPAAGPKVRLDRAERKRAKKPRHKAGQPDSSAVSAAGPLRPAEDSALDQQTNTKDGRRSRQRVRGNVVENSAEPASSQPAQAGDGDHHQERNHVEPPARHPDRPREADAPPHHQSSQRNPRDRRNEMAERALRGLVTTRGTQVTWSAALRARDVASPTAQDMAEAERDLVIVRRNYTPPEPLATSRKAAPEQQRRAEPEQKRPPRKGERQRNTGRGY